MVISIIIPTYKNRGMLPRAVDSALNQIGADVEVIVVDDNSPESDARKQTEAIMSHYEHDKRVKYIRHAENRNGAAARNTGIRASKGEYIAFLDDDDFFLPEKVAKQVAYLKIHTDKDAVYCLAERDGRRYGSTTFEGDATKHILMLETCMYTPCLMFRRNALLAINGFDEGFRRHQDYDLLLRFFHAGYKIGCLREILTEIGTNEGENIPSGQKLEEMKAYFFEKFMPYIKEIEQEEPGFKNKVLAKHYGGVFLNHVKQKNFKMAWNTLGTYFPMSPATFYRVIKSSLMIHIKRSL